MITLSAPVGKGAKNRPVDLAIVQHLLNKNFAHAGLTSVLEVDGNGGEETNAAIETFQRNALKQKAPDGKVDPGGKTLKELAKAHKDKTTLVVLRSILRPSLSSTLTRPDDASSTLSIINIQRFLDLYERQFVKLGADARGGLEELLGFINGDYDIMDVGWAAYMLATVKHECAERWKPIKEFGQGAGKAYGNPVTVTGSDGKKYTHTYYGRGYVQLTWKKNYESIGQALGLGDGLVIDPARVLNSATAYSIMSYGMRNGTFTTKELSDYIDKNKCDYEHARQIINGLDQFKKIAGFAEGLEILLRLGCYGSSSDSSF
jgi:predicted chitinase